MDIGRQGVCRMMVDLLLDVLCGCRIVLAIGITIGLIVAFIYMFKEL